MMKWIRIAMRNIRKNSRRSMATLLAVSLAFAALSIFRGYTHHTYFAIRQSAIRGEGLGHLTIYKEGWLAKGKSDPGRYMFSQQEFQKIIDIVEEEDKVVLATPQMQISGLISNGKNSTIFVGNGVMPSDASSIRGAWSAFRPVRGEGLSNGKNYGVEVAEELAEFLDLHLGSTAVLMTTTLDDQINAMDIEVVGLYDTGSAATNDKFIRAPFPLAQSLLDTGKADRVVVLLDSLESTETMREVLGKRLQEAGFACEIKSWDEISPWYSKVKNLFDMIFFFIFIIVLIIVVMSVVNTMGMTVVERTREIGTLRAMGLKRKSVNLLFAIEGALLGVLGSLLGLGLNVVGWAIIRVSGLSYTPPGSSSPVPLVVHLVPEVMAGLVVFLVLLSLVSSVLPARRAAKLNVVDALGHI